MIRALSSLAILCLFASACSDPGDASGPPVIVYGRDLCVECGMLITEERFAAAYRVGTEARRFDDIGNMLLYGTKTGELPGATPDAWVHDRDTGDWVAANDAWFVIADGVVTPMGYGIVAFASQDRATEYAQDRDGELFLWDDLFELTIEPGRLVHGHSTDDAEHNQGEGP